MGLLGQLSGTPDSCLDSVRSPPFLLYFLLLKLNHFTWPIHRSAGSFGCSCLLWSSLVNSAPQLLRISALTCLLGNFLWLLHLYWYAAFVETSFFSFIFPCFSCSIFKIVDLKSFPNKPTSHDSCAHPCFFSWFIILDTTAYSVTMLWELWKSIYLLSRSCYYLLWFILFYGVASKYFWKKTCWSSLVLKLSFCWVSNQVGVWQIFFFSNIWELWGLGREQ